MKLNYNNFHSFTDLEGKSFRSSKGVKFVWQDTGICFDDQKVYVQLYDPSKDESHFILLEELEDFTLIVGQPII
jgi:hypothetical protein